MEFERPDGDPTFTAPWFRWFFPHLTLPESTDEYPMHVRWEPHLLLMTDEFFRPELVHLLVLIPKGNYKTTWEGGLGNWHLVTVPAPQAFGGASDLEQAKELYRFSAHFAGCIPDLEERLLVRESTREIRTVEPGGLFKILASDDSQQKGKKQGKNSTLGMIDEYHAHENDNLATDILSGGGKRRHNAQISGYPLWWTIGKVANISTAGWNKEGPLGLLREQFLTIDQRGGTIERDLVAVADDTRPEGYRLERDTEKGRLTICRSRTGSNVMLEWALRDEDDPRGGDDVDDLDVVKLASPATGVTIGWLDEERETLPPSAFARYHGNRWTLGEKSWLPPGAWAELRSDAVPVTMHRTWEDATCTDELDEHGNPKPTEEFSLFVASLFPAGSQIVAALDMARYRDTAAVVAITVDPYTGKKVPRSIVWKSGGPFKPIRYDWPKTALRCLHTTYNLRACGADPKYADQLVEELRDEGIPMEDFPQSNERIGPADTDLYREICGEGDNPGEFAHDGDPTLAAHLAAGRALDIGPKLFKVVQQDGANPPPIDACKALSMANALLKFTPTEFSADVW